METPIRTGSPTLGEHLMGTEDPGCEEDRRDGGNRRCSLLIV